MVTTLLWAGEANGQMQTCPFQLAADDDLGFILLSEAIIAIRQSSSNFRNDVRDTGFAFEKGFIE